MQTEKEKLEQFAALQAKNLTEKKRAVIALKRQLKTAEAEVMNAENSMFFAVDKLNKCS